MPPRLGTKPARGAAYKSQHAGSGAKPQHSSCLLPASSRQISTAASWAKLGRGLDTTPGKGSGTGGEFRLLSLAKPQHFFSQLEVHNACSLLSCGVQQASALSMCVYGIACVVLADVCTCRCVCYIHICVRAVCKHRFNYHRKREGRIRLSLPGFKGQSRN